jgi:hypothetical protein
MVEYSLRIIKIGQIFFSNKTKTFLGRVWCTHQCQGITPVILGSASAQAQYADIFSTKTSSASAMTVPQHLRRWLSVGLGPVALKPNSPGTSHTDWCGFSFEMNLS